MKTSLRKILDQSRLQENSICKTFGQGLITYDKEKCATKIFDEKKLTTDVKKMARPAALSTQKYQKKLPHAKSKHTGPITRQGGENFRLKTVSEMNVT